jgi:uncharacterized protein (TIGR03083 family)
MPAPDALLAELRASVERLRDLVTPLDDRQLEAPAYPNDWTIADVLSHLGSGAVIMQRRLEDALAGQPTPDDFANPIWDAWNAKSPRQKADDALLADRAALTDVESLNEQQRSDFQYALGPMTFDFDEFVGLRLNEHVLHSWDIATALDAAATLPSEAAGLVVDNLGLIARFTAKLTGTVRTVTVRTTDPARTFVIGLDSGSVTFTPSDPTPESGDADVTLPAEAFVRLVYGRLDPEHTPSASGDAALLDELRRVYPGP